MLDAAPIGFVELDPDLRLLAANRRFYEIIGRTLHVRSGVDLRSFAGTTRQVLVEVSDGRNLAADGVEMCVWHWVNHQIHITRSQSRRRHKGRW